MMKRVKRKAFIKRELAKELFFVNLRNKFFEALSLPPSLFNYGEH